MESERILAYIDESGNFGYEFDKEGVSEYFIISAIVITEKAKDNLICKTDMIREMFFQKGEMKSSSIGGNHKRRVKLLNELLKLEFKIFAVVIDKKKIFENNGLRYKAPFYKFINNILHKELGSAFKFLTICNDETGSNEFMQSFTEYVKEKSKPLDLFGEQYFSFENSKNNVLIQLADIISGTLTFEYETIKKDSSNPTYLRMLSKHLLHIQKWPKDIESYIYQKDVINKDYNFKIAKIAYEQAQQFINNNNNTNDESILHQVYVLKYLCFRFINNQERKYISTKELISQLRYKTGQDIKTHYFRSKIIAKLRDSRVLIASSKQGYKIPSNENEIYDFINHGTNVIMPLLSRLKKCRDVINKGTLGEIDIFEHTEYKTLNKFFENESKNQQ